MRRRLYSPKASAAPKVTVVRVEGAGALVTLDDPRAPPTSAQDAFCRLRPPEGATPDEVASWRDLVAKVARAVRVMAAPKSSPVPLASQRLDAGPIRSVRDEAEALARETGDERVVALVKRLLDEAGA